MEYIKLEQEDPLKNKNMDEISDLIQEFFSVQTQHFDRVKKITLTWEAVDGSNSALANYEQGKNNINFYAKNVRQNARSNYDGDLKKAIVLTLAHELGHALDPNLKQSDMQRSQDYRVLLEHADQPLKVEGLIEKLKTNMIAVEETARDLGFLLLPEDKEFKRDYHETEEKNLNYYRGTRFVDSLQPDIATFKQIIEQAEIAFSDKNPLKVNYYCLVSGENKVSEQLKSIPNAVFFESDTFCYRAFAQADFYIREESNQSFTITDTKQVTFEGRYDPYGSHTCPRSAYTVHQSLAELISYVKEDVRENNEFRMEAAIEGNQLDLVKQLVKIGVVPTKEQKLLALEVDKIMNNSKENKISQALVNLMPKAKSKTVEFELF